MGAESWRVISRFAPRALAVPRFEGSGFGRWRSFLAQQRFIPLTRKDSRHVAAGGRLAQALSKSATYGLAMRFRAEVTGNSLALTPLAGIMPATRLLTASRMARSSTLPLSAAVTRRAPETQNLTVGQFILAGTAGREKQPRRSGCRRC